MANIRKYQQDHKLNVTEALESLALKLPSFSDKPQSDVPMGIQEPMTPERKALIERLAEKPVAPPCNFLAKISDTEIECGRDLKHGKKPLRISTASCIACWERREWAKRKRDSEREDNPQPQEQEPEKPRIPPNPYMQRTREVMSKRLRHEDPDEIIYCELKGRSAIKDVPCMQRGDTMRTFFPDCHHKECERRLLKMIEDPRLST